ncbi:MAG: AzlC family ABC transporter permease [Phascolarctobacterium sp.]|nr:AzlC family ABC transporter permease [Phascolarctobacterium sp.]
MNGKYSFSNPTNKSVFREGMKDGFPIGMGYFAVAFSLCIIVNNAGLTPFQGFLSSILCKASAGQYAGYTVIINNEPYIEMVIMMLVINARYLLMGCAESNRLAPDIPWLMRLFMADMVTDEIFAVTMSRPGFLNPYYTFGVGLVAGPLWAVGTALGAMVGNLMPANIVSAFSVALYGMFLAVIITPAGKDKIIACVVGISFIASYLCSVLPVISQISEGMRIIILTIIIAGIAAILYPVPIEEDEA